MPHIDYYLATISPFCYLSGTRLEEIAAKHDATITYKPVDAMQVFTAMGGQPPSERHPSRNEYRAQELPRVAKHQGLKLNPKPAFFPTNMAPSSYAIIAAQEAGGGNLGGLVHGLMAACWAEEKDISQDDVIRECLEANGFEGALVDKGLLTGADNYARNMEDAKANGVFGIPFYIVRETGERFWGQDRLSYLDAHLAEM